MFLKKTKEKNGGQSRWECFDEFWRDVSTFVSLMEGFLFILIYIYIYGCLCFIYTGLCCFMFTTSIYVRLFEIVTVAAVCWIDARSLLWLWTLSNFKIVVTQNE